MKNNSYYIWGDRGYKFQSENERVQQMFEPGNMLLCGRPHWGAEEVKKYEEKYFDFFNIFKCNWISLCI